MYVKAKANAKARDDDGDKKDAERGYKRKVDAFKSYLRHLPITIRIGDTWTQVKPSLSGLEFDALEEDQRVVVFDKLIRRLQVLLTYLID